MRCVYLDFESYYNSSLGYTIRKMSTEQYIRSSLFKSQLLSYAIDDEPVCVALPHQIPDVLASLHLNHPDTYVFMLNAKFDAGIIEFIYNMR